MFEVAGYGVGDVCVVLGGVLERAGVDWCFGCVGWRVEHVEGGCCFNGWGVGDGGEIAQCCCRGHVGEFVYGLVPLVALVGPGVCVRGFADGVSPGAVVVGERQVDGGIGSGSDDGVVVGDTQVRYVGASGEFGDECLGRVGREVSGELLGNGGAVFVDAALVVQSRQVGVAFGHCGI